MAAAADSYMDAIFLGTNHSGLDMGFLCRGHDDDRFWRQCGVEACIADVGTEDG